MNALGDMADKGVKEGSKQVHERMLVKQERSSPISSGVTCCGCRADILYIYIYIFTYIDKHIQHVRATTKKGAQMKT